jgi:hypothetical protein
MLRFVFVLALMGVVGITAAQDSTLFFCGELPDADCALLRNAQASVKELRSAAFEYTMTSHLDIPDNDEDAVQTMAVRGRITDLPRLDTPSAVMEAMRDADAAATVSFVMSGFPSTLPDGSPPPVEIPGEMAAEMRLVDGILYVNLDSVQPAPDDPLLVGWASFDLNNRIETRLQQIANRTDNIAPIASGLDVDLLVDTFDENVLSEFVHVMRNGNEFHTAVDFATMYANAEYQSVLREQLLARWYGTGRGGSITDTHLERLAEMMARVFPQSQVVRTVTVDPVNGVISGYSAWSMWDFDIMIEAALQGNDVTTWGLATFEQSLTLDDFNADFTIAAPQDAEPISAEALSAIQVVTALPLPING